jgi:hypothetical protein
VLKVEGRAGRKPPGVPEEKCKPRAKPSGGSRFFTRETGKNVPRPQENYVSKDSASRFRFSEPPSEVRRIAPLGRLGQERIAPVGGAIHSTTYGWCGPIRPARRALRAALRDSLGLIGDAVF